MINSDEKEDMDKDVMLESGNGIEISEQMVPYSNLNIDFSNQHNISNKKDYTRPMDPMATVVVSWNEYEDILRRPYSDLWPNMEKSKLICQMM